MQARDYRLLAALLDEAAQAIAEGIIGSFADEENQHPAARRLRRTERKCKRTAQRLNAAAACLEYEKKRRNKC